jgi:hypothetical protein
MRRRIAFLAVILFVAVGSSVSALYGVTNKGTWPESWPKELDPLRKVSRTLTGPIAPRPHYEIPFAKREDFESAWPHLLKVASKGAPIILVRGPDSRLGIPVKAGVRIYAPPPQKGNRVMPEEPLPGQRDARETWMYTTFIELIVDGDIVDLNRVPLPPGVPIVDERFRNGESKSPPDKSAASSEASVTLMGALAEWMYPGSTFGGAEMSDGGNRTEQSVNCQAVLMTSDSFENVTRFYERKFVSGPRGVATELNGIRGQSVSVHDDSSKRPVHVRVITVNRANTSTTLAISRVDGEAETHDNPGAAPDDLNTSFVKRAQGIGDRVASLLQFVSAEIGRCHAGHYAVAATARGVAHSLTASGQGAMTGHANQARPSSAMRTKPLKALACFSASSAWEGVCTIGLPTLREVFTDTSTPSRRPIALR